MTNVGKTRSQSRFLLVAVFAFAAIGLNAEIVYRNDFTTRASAKPVPAVAALSAVGDIEVRNIKPGKSVAEGTNAPSANPDTLVHYERMMFNNPGLEVDLSLGIWCHAAVYDYDKDGKMDIVANASCCPFVSRKVRGRICRLYLAPTEAHEGKDVPISARHPPKRGPQLDTGGVKNPHPRPHRGLRLNVVDFDTDGVEDVVFTVRDWTHYGAVGPACPYAYTSDGVWTNSQIETYVYFVRNEGTQEKPRWAAPVTIVSEGDKGNVLQGPWGGVHAMFHDFDGDGDMDFMTGEFVDNFWYFENIAGKGKPPKFAKGRKAVAPDGTPLAVDLCMFDPVLVDYDGDGIQDIVEAEEDGRVAVFAGTGKFRDGTPVFQKGRYLRQKAQELKFGCLATPFGCDWDGDGDWDFICGNSAGYISFIENLSGPGVERPKWAEPRYLTTGGRRIRTMAGWNNSPQGPAERKWGYSGVSVGDWDGDGILDVVVNDSIGLVQLYRGLRRGGTEVAPGEGIDVEWIGRQPMPAWDWRQNVGTALRVPWRSTVYMIDWNKDGLQDLIAQDHEGYLCFFERFRRNDGSLGVKAPQRTLCMGAKGQPFRICEREKGGSGRARFCIADWDLDGRRDIIQAAWNAWFTRNIFDDGAAAVFKREHFIGHEQLHGHTGMTTVVDFDNNGVPDLVVAPEDGYFYYLRNPRSSSK